jgi:hypothetical protein
MDTTIAPAKTPGTDVEQPPAQDRGDHEPDDDRGARDVLRSVLPILVGSVAVGIAAVAVIGVQLNRRRTSKTLLGRAAAKAEDAMDALVHAAAGLPERGKTAMRRVCH